MRKNSPRKWLHACLDLLPVILIPVFMIYSHRHDVTENVEVQYKYQSNEVNTLDDLIEGNIYHFNITNNSLDSYITDNYDTSLIFNFVNIIEYDFSNYTSSIEISETITTSYESNGYISVYFNVSESYATNLDFYLTNNGVNDYFISIYIGELDNNFTLVGDFIYKGVTPHIYDISFITRSDYNVIESVDIENTDVMDSFMNHFNNTIDRHFNMGNVFNLTGVYQWFNTNIFNGNAPQIIYSVWNIALYELVMDLLFLLYGLFMWFIDMVQHLMDKPFKSIK